MIALRPAWPTDAGKLARILWRFQECSDWLPDLYSEVETIALCGQMIDFGWVTVAEGDSVQGFVARDKAEICSLYVDDQAKGQGLGTALLDHAKAHSPRLTLRSFQQNRPANRFYEHQGFVEVGRSNGFGNDENLPDIAYFWARPSHRSNR